MGKIRRRVDKAGYIDTTPSGESRAFALMGTGFTDQGDSPSAKTSNKRYVNMKSDTTNITGYAWSSPFTYDDIPDDEAIAFINAIGEEEKTGVDADTTYVQVNLLKPIALSGTEYEAKKRAVAVELTDFSDNDGEMQGSGNLLAKDDWVKGKFDVKTKTFTEVTE